MMSLAIVFFAIIAGFSVWAFERYFGLAKRSLANAEAIEPKLASRAQKLLEDDDTPESVAKIVFGLMVVTGCGCFVRGVIVYHYLPRFRGRETNTTSWDQAFDDVGRLPENDRTEFHEFLALAIIYDSYRNPLQGWFFRRTIRSFSQKPTLSFQYRLAAMGAAFSILSHRKGDLRKFRI